jgi:DNA repair exonuclease SbcCD ATPase subunit
MNQKLDKKEERLHKLDLKLREQKKQLQEEKAKVNSRIHILEVKQIEINQQLEYIQKYNQYLTNKHNELSLRQNHLPEISKQWEQYIENQKLIAKQWEEYNETLKKESQKYKSHTKGPLLPPGTDLQSKSTKEAWIRFHKGKLKQLGI